MPTTRTVVFVVFPGFQALDLTGPHEVFAQAGGYRCVVAAHTAGPVPSSSGLPVHAGAALADLAAERIDTLVVVGGSGVDQACRDLPTVEWVRDAAPRARRVASVCSGVLLLAAAGVVAGKTVTTHWSRAAQVARVHPDVTVDADPIFVRDGSVWTSAGVTAGMDLALALVEDDLGREAAHAVARELVLFLRRPGSQSQFSVPMRAARSTTDPIRAATDAVATDPAARHTVDTLAARAGLSARHFQRRFTAECGVSPTAYVEEVRVEAARRALAEGDDPVESVARHCGFGTAETLRRTFHRRLGVSPSDYRERFRSSRPAAPRP
ncbi:GlxA family transcriptional regulator [Yinghuangia seranimata]|uniref:GlxA family transcriptional regulator n=1 Tax=Yinghuangia seranimata TaxID=408067 RepID=UPI00248B1B7A|nr:GlxA family transcriptional regulator [Yinghuangia seranimata]MDI2124525.1 GlxA family transcriptional regulator [Yinghuangia seranimata]